MPSTTLTSIWLTFQFHPIMTDLSFNFVNYRAYVWKFEKTCDRTFIQFVWGYLSAHNTRLRYSHFTLAYSAVVVFPALSFTALDSVPEGGPKMFDVSFLSGLSELSFDSTLLSHLLFYCLLSLFSFFFSFCLLAHYTNFFSEKSSIIFVRRWAFWYGSCLAARRW